MNPRLLQAGAIAFLLTYTAAAQENRTAPMYQVTVIERTVKAVNYMYQSGPTPIDFRGTVLAPEARGGAIVESKAGRTEIDARIERLDAPQRFGSGYLTYVLWAITPEGHAKNLGELIPNGSDKVKLHVTTDLQAFGLIVSAEPYSAVRRPSDAVVMENVVRPDTIGKVESIEARYELLPRGRYTYTIPEAGRRASTEAAKVPMPQYETMLQVYEAQNAVQIAEAAGADRYAPDVMSKARGLLASAQQLGEPHGDRPAAIMAAREAAQTAEDARMITLERQHDAQVTQARQQADQERQMRLQAEARAKTAEAEATANQNLLNQERAARERAEARAAVVPPPAPAPAKTVVILPPQPAPNPEAVRAELRSTLRRELNAAMPTLDTPRGLVVTIQDNFFLGNSIHHEVAARLVTIAGILQSHPGLTIQVAGHCDTMSASQDKLAYDHAQMVRDALLRGGVPASSISALSLGATKPLASNRSAAGRAENRRVEITIAGDPVGTAPAWDRSYSVTRR